MSANRPEMIGYSVIIVGVDGRARACQDLGRRYLLHPYIMTGVQNRFRLL